MIALLSALLLVSQQTAVTHTLWHQARDAVHPDTPSLLSDASHEHDDDVGTLCAFDAMLGQLLHGGSIAGAVELPALEAGPPVPSSVRHLYARLSVQPRSRDPPVFL